MAARSKPSFSAYRLVAPTTKPVAPAKVPTIAVPRLTSFGLPVLPSMPMYAQTQMNPLPPMRPAMPSVDVRVPVIANPFQTQRSIESYFPQQQVTPQITGTPTTSVAGILSEQQVMPQQRVMAQMANIPTISVPNIFRGR